MSRLMTLIALGALLAAGAAGPLVAPAGAAIVSVVWSPEDPVEGETLVVDLAGEMADGCWVFDSGAFSLDGDVLAVDAYVVDTWEQGVPCPDVVVPYAVTAEFVGLPAGEYTLRVTEHHDSPRDPEDVVETYTILVEPTVAVDAVTWSALKRVYE